MTYKNLKKSVYLANIVLVDAGLVVMTFGNVSGVDRDKGVMAVKPSGVAYDDLAADSIVVVSLETGEVVEGDLNPSSDTPTHLCLYRKFMAVGGITHTHSTYATIWAQSCREIPCLGTTHADYFYGAVPLTRELTPVEIEQDYEANTGRVIVECFHGNELNPEQMPAVLLPYHGPFTWGSSPQNAVDNAIALEAVAKIGFHTMLLDPDVPPISRWLFKKHFERKHGPDAYYGQTT